MFSTCERYSSKTTELILMQSGINLSQGKGVNGRPRGLEVKDQGHRRPKLCLEVWRRHHSRSLELSRQRHTVSDGNVAFIKGRRVAHRFNCTPSPRLSICVLLTHLLYSCLLGMLHPSDLCVNSILDTGFSNCYDGLGVIRCNVKTTSLH